MCPVLFVLSASIQLVRHMEGLVHGNYLQSVK